jgi:hypothetical protein
VTLFGEQCDMESKKYGQECAESVFAQINKDGWSSLEALRQCIGGQQEDKDHPIMEAQLAAQKGDEGSGEGEVSRLCVWVGQGLTGWSQSVVWGVCAAWLPASPPRLAPCHHTHTLHPAPAPASAHPAHISRQWDAVHAVPLSKPHPSSSAPLFSPPLSPPLPLPAGVHPAHHPHQRGAVPRQDGHSGSAASHLRRVCGRQHPAGLLKGGWVGWGVVGSGLGITRR